MSIEAAGWERPIVFAEPDADVPSGVECVRHSTRQGSWRNFRNAGLKLLGSRPDAIAIFQDDIAVAANARAWIESQLWPDPLPGVVSLYTSGMAAEKYPPGWFTIEGRRIGNRTWGALAIIMHPSVVRRLIANPPYPHSASKTDVHLGNFCGREGLAWCQYNPSLVQHLGEKSTFEFYSPPSRPVTRPLTAARQAGDWCRDARALPFGDPLSDLLARAPGGP